MSVFRLRYQWEIRSRSASLLFAGAVMLFIGGIWVAILAKDVYYAHRFAQDGRMASAAVIKTGVHRGADNGTSNTAYEVDYVFSTADGRKVASSDTVDPNTWDKIAERGSVDVEYAASDPTINRIGTSTGVSVLASMMLIVGPVVGLLGATLAIKGLLALRASPVSAGLDPSDTPAVASGGWSTIEGQPQPLLHVWVRVNRWIMIGGILLVVGATMLFISVAVLRQEQLFHAEGRTGTAIVLTKSSHVAYNQQTRSQSIEYDVGYRFTTQNGASVQGSNEVNLRTWKSIRERDPIQIVYLPEHPATSRLVANDPGTSPRSAIVLGEALAAGGTLILSYGLFDVARTRRRARK
jgi:hypothetical protein